MAQWRSVDPEDCYGIVIYNYNPKDDYKLQLVVGDAVQIISEEEEWFYGCTINNRQVEGIFPKSYIHQVECIVDNSGPHPIFFRKHPPIVHEITTVLKEWKTHWKNLYVTHNENFEKIRNQINELLKYRSKIISGTLPIDELKQVTRLACAEIDTGNKTLGLDLVVRDKDGNLINPDEISTIQLYNLHKAAAERIKSKSQPKEVQAKSAIQQYSHIFIVAVKNFTCKMSEDAELLMTLYDAKDFKAITENYVVRWSKDGLMSDLDQMYNLRVMFTDLGKKDLERERIFFICYVIRIGTMDIKEIDHRRSSVATSTKKSCADGMRRPFGVAAMEVTDYMNGKLDSDLEQEFSIPFFSCERDNLEQTLRKITNRDIRGEIKNQSLFISLKLLHGDLKQVREENPHLVLGNVAIARKMGFPEVILPGDVRNDLYLTLVKGEFPKGNKTSDKNVEVVVKVCNDSGVAIPGVISLGGGFSPLNEYRSVIYYHEDKPQWYETFKVAIPIEEFKTSHLRFTFKHRSSSEAKDKSEKPFAMCYVKLMQINGTTLKDAEHQLVVYKIDHKKFDENGVDYYTLPSTVAELRELHNSKPQAPGLMISSKDSFIISSNICSTKLTQNVDLLGLLNWNTHPETLKDSLEALMKVDGEEVVKFLQDILDALFNILMHDPDDDTYDKLIFECLLHIISLVSNDWKYQHFEPVLDLYIKESFSATLAYEKLISVLNYFIDNSDTVGRDKQKDLVFRTMKSLQYIMKFIVRSRLLYTELHAEKDDAAFEGILSKLLDSIVTMMCQTSKMLLREQGACLKYLPSTIPEILKVFNAKKLSCILCDLLRNMPSDTLTKQKMMTVNEIVHSQLFLYPDCRQILLPVFTRLTKTLLEQKEEGISGMRSDKGKNMIRSMAKVARMLGETEQQINEYKGVYQEVELCIKILSDILDLLFRSDIGPVEMDISEIMLTILRTVIQSHINMDRETPNSGILVAIMLDIFRQMTGYHYEKYINHFATRTDILDFLMEILLVFKDLVNKTVFELDWCEMILLQNYVILKALRFFSNTIRDHFFEKFDNQAWSNFFHCAIAFMTQPTLQLETFSANKRNRIIKRYKDMRRETGFEVRSMWFNLGQYKIQFVPSLVENILEMTFIPETELRKATIPIFFDMMQCEFYSSKYEFESFGDTKRDASQIKGQFCDFENEIVSKLDTLIEGGRGDEQFKDLFNQIMTNLCSNHMTMKEDGLRFVNMATKLIERLLEYRCIINDENKQNRMSCTVNLLEFYSEINRKEMYIRYVNKLCELHTECDNYTEAAYSLQLHSNLLGWSDDLLPLLLKSNRYPNAQTHRELKEELYYNIIDYYSKGKMWECALQKCQELAKQYEEETFDYERLADLHKRMATYYEDIMKQTRAESEYFRVGYYGMGFPPFLQNKVFVYRGKEYERLAEFSSRTLNEFPNAELLNKLTPPGMEILKSPKQYIQINKVDPVMEEKKQRFSGKPVAEQIVKYYKFNHVQKFRYSRPFIRKDPKMDNDNEFANLWLERNYLTISSSLPGILRWFSVQSTHVEEISPLRNAVETMENSNKEIRDLIILFNRDRAMPLNTLSMKLNGIVDPAVMGGIMNYEKAFFTDDYVNTHPNDHELLQRLKDLIADQVPLLEICIQIHRDRAPPSLLPLHKRLEECFRKMQESVIDKYGKKTCDLKMETTVTMRRHYSINNNSRLQDVNSTASESDGSHRRVSSLTRAQITTLKHLTSSFNFTVPSTPLNSSKSGLNTPSKSSILSQSRSMIGTPYSTQKKSKTPKEKRRSSTKSENIITPINLSSTQWYTSESEPTPTAVITPTANGTPVFELRQELTPKRPLRSEIEKEKRLSRPSSGQFSRPSSLSLTIRAASSSGNSSNRDSVGTTDSSISEEDLVPPPLPIKHREVDYCNIPNNNENYSFLHSNRNSIRNTLTTSKNPAPPFEEMYTDVIKEPPPPPPPKPPKKKAETPLSP